MPKFVPRLQISPRTLQEPRCPVTMPGKAQSPLVGDSEVEITPHDTEHAPQAVNLRSDPTTNILKLCGPEIRDKMNIDQADPTISKAQLQTVHPTNSNVLMHDTASPPESLSFHSDDASPCTRAVAESAMPYHFGKNFPEALELVPRAICLLHKNTAVGLHQPPKPPKLGSEPHSVHSEGSKQPPRIPSHAPK